jgi:hypothetical protein
VDVTTGTTGIIERGLITKFTAIALVAFGLSKWSIRHDAHAG